MDREEMRAALLARRERDGQAESSGFETQNIVFTGNRKYSVSVQMAEFERQVQRLVDEYVNVALSGKSIGQWTFRVVNVGGNPK